MFYIDISSFHINMYNISFPRRSHVRIDQARSTKLTPQPTRSSEGSTHTSRPSSCVTKATTVTLSKHTQSRTRINEPARSIYSSQMSHLLRFIFHKIHFQKPYSQPYSLLLLLFIIIIFLFIIYLNKSTEVT